MRMRLLTSTGIAISKLKKI